MSPNERPLAHTAGAHYSHASHSPLDPENFADRHIGIDVPGLAAMLESLDQRNLDALQHAVVPKAILRGLTARDGHRSVWTGVDDETLVPQDRSNRGMGGFKGNVRLSNYVWLESSINGLIESDPVWAAEARVRGVKISRYADPAEVPVVHAVHGICLLDDAGGATTI